MTVQFTPWEEADLANINSVIATEAPAAKFYAMRPTAPVAAVQWFKMGDHALVTAGGRRWAVDSDPAETLVDVEEAEAYGYRGAVQHGDLEGQLVQPGDWIVLEGWAWHVQSDEVFRSLFEVLPDEFQPAAQPVAVVVQTEGTTTGDTTTATPADGPASNADTGGNTVDTPAT